VDLKKGLADAVAGFDDREGRQRVLIFLGDGKSIANPLDAADRARLCDDMAKREVAFFAVPLGNNPEPANLHTFISGTGGKCVRLDAADKPEDFVKRLNAAVAEPIFYPKMVKLPDAVSDVLPGRLPPLRRDTATLVVGKVK